MALKVAYLALLFVLVTLSLPEKEAISSSPSRSSVTFLVVTVTGEDCWAGRQGGRMVIPP